MMSADDQQKASNSERVLDAVKELARLDQVATRDNVAQLTGLTLTTVDDRLKVLADDGKLKRLVRGIYMPTMEYRETRAVSVTELPDGYTLCEIGDQCLVLNPREARMLGRGLAGHVDDFRAGESIARHLVISTELSCAVEQLGREVRKMKADQAAGVTSAAGAKAPREKRKSDERHLHVNG